ncbi:MAG: leucine-rich repeat protein [Lachnospiraceae bacterium]|nr:leucine-rich repeat protein [Lachnospiraceae bacterium]
MVFTNIKKLTISIVLISAMVLGVVPAYPEAADSKTDTDVQKPQPLPSAVAESKYESTDRQDAFKLLKQNKFTVSNPAVEMKAHENGKGVLIKGDSPAIKESRFTFGETISFGTQNPGYIVVDALADRQKDTSLLFYLDDEEEYFASVKLNSIKRKNYWDYKKNICKDIKDKNITGMHKVSFKVVTEEKNNVTFMMRSIFFTNNDIPVLDFDIDEKEGSIGEMNGDPGHNTECYGKVSVKVPDGYISEYTDKKSSPGTYSLEYIRGRGNSTWSPSKKPYKFKLKTSTDFFGMGKNKNWILLANHFDVSMLRNKITYWLGAGTGMEFTPECIFVDVIMNGQYLGSYYLCEQIRVGKNRVDIDDLEADEAAKNITTGPAITGGYLLSLSPYTQSDNMKQIFSTKRGNAFGIQSPSFDDYFNEAQCNYISQYIQKTEDAIFGEDFKDPDGISYKEYMDIDSAACYYWVQEISNNGDAYISSSTYLYKKRNGKLFWGPLWDFDYVAWGNTDTDTKGFRCDSEWFSRLLQDKTFVEKLMQKWPAFKEKLLYACKDGGQIDQYAAQLYNSQKANYNVNSIYSGIWNEEKAEEKTFESETERFKKWVYNRVNWIDKNIGLLYPAEFKITFMSDGKIYKEDTFIKNSINGIIPPEPPVKKGYVFKGWYTKEITDGKEKETLLKGNMGVDEDTVFYAKWIAESQLIKASDITFACDEVTYFAYDVFSAIPVYTMPFNAEVPEVTYTSSDTSIVDIAFNESSQDLPSFYTLKPGDVTITATTKDGLEASCLLHVIGYEDEVYTENPVFSLDYKEITVEQGSYARIKPKYSYDKIPYLSYTFNISDNNIAEINEAGYIYAKKAGTACIGVTCNGTEDIQFCIINVTGKDTGKGNTSGNTNKDVGFTSGVLKYKVTGALDGGAVKCIGITDKSILKIKIPDTVTYNGVKLKVTAIGKAAFKGCKKLKKAVIGKNVTKIGRKAFYNCKSLKLLDIKSKKLKTAGKNATGRVSGSFRIKAPEGKYKKYLEMFK